MTVRVLQVCPGDVTCHNGVHGQHRVFRTHAACATATEVILRVWVWVCCQLSVIARAEEEKLTKKLTKGCQGGATELVCKCDVHTYSGSVFGTVVD